MASIIHILGLGAVGSALAAALTHAGQPVLALRTSRHDIPPASIPITIHGEHGELTVPVRTLSLSHLRRLDGPLVVTTKAHANPALAAALADRAATGPLVILQNGLGVEDPFLARPGFTSILRGVLYVTGQTGGETHVTFRAVHPSPLGLVRGSGDSLPELVARLNTTLFPFRPEPDITREVWRKTIVNAVFNSICPLLEVDNGIFARDPSVTALARGIVRECLVLAHARGLTLTETEIMEQILKISHGSGGVLISTLQDLRNHRPTEIEFLNLALSRLARSHTPPIDLRQTDLLGRLVLARSRLAAGSP